MSSKLEAEKTYEKKCFAKNTEFSKRKTFMCLTKNLLLLVP